MSINRPRIPFNGPFLAPMVRTGFVGMRSTCYYYGCKAVFTEAIIANNIAKCERYVDSEKNYIYYLPKVSHAGTKRDYERHTLDIYKSDVIPVIVQLAVADPINAVDAYNLIKEDISGIDINMGCSKKFTSQGGMGGALIQSSETRKDALNIIKSLCKAIESDFYKDKVDNNFNCENEVQNRTHLSIKTRIIQNRSESLEFYKKSAMYCDMISIHMRYRLEERATTKARWDEFLSILFEFYDTFYKDLEMYNKTLENYFSNAKNEIEDNEKKTMQELKDIYSSIFELNNEKSEFDFFKRIKEYLSEKKRVFRIVANGDIEDVPTFTEFMKKSTDYYYDWLEKNKSSKEKVEWFNKRVGLSMPVMIARGAVRNPSFFNLFKQQAHFNNKLEDAKKLVMLPLDIVYRRLIYTTAHICGNDIGAYAAVKQSLLHSLCYNQICLDSIKAIRFTSKFMDIRNLILRPDHGGENDSKSKKQCINKLTDDICHTRKIQDIIDIFFNNKDQEKVKLEDIMDSERCKAIELAIKEEESGYIDFNF